MSKNKKKNNSPFPKNNNSNNQKKTLSTSKNEQSSSVATIEKQIKIELKEPDLAEIEAFESAVFAATAFMPSFFAIVSVGLVGRTRDRVKVHGVETWRDRVIDPATAPIASPGEMSTTQPDDRD
jgi:hypothetical protein